MAQGTESCKSWFIAFACSAANCLLMCPYRLSGLLFVGLLEKYNTDREKASMPIFMFFLMLGLIGPLSGWIGHKIGEEMTALTGCFIAAVGFGATYYAENITTAIISLGLVYGFGMSMGITLIPNILKKHFTKNYNTACGINAAGPCIGTLIFPPIAVFMLNIYGVSGTFLIIGGLMLHGVPICMILKVAIPKTMDQSQKLQKENTVEDYFSKINDFSMDKFENQMSFSMKKPCILDTSPRSRANIKSHSTKNVQELEINEMNEVDLSNNVQSIRIKHIVQHSNLYSQNNAQRNNRTSFHLFFKLLKDPCFLVYMTIVSLTAYITTVVWTTTIDYSRDKRIDTKYEVYLLMFPSLMDLIGRLALVWVVDKKYISSTVFTIIINFMLALSTGMMIFSTNITVLMTGALFFGLGTGALITVFPGQVFEFMEKDFYIMAMSSRMLLYVPLSFTASPLVEYFRTELRSYDGLYYLVIVLCLLMCCITPLISRFSKVNK